MSDLFFNKVAAALLVSAIGFIGINKMAEKVVHADIPEPSAFAYRLAPIETTSTETEILIPFPSAAWIASQDITKGAKVFKKCTSCHTAEIGGRSTTGPALWNIVGSSIGTADGFNYSSAMSSHGGVWGYEELDAFLSKPKTFIPKTKMAFNGIKKETDRAALIAFLRLKADAPIDALTEAAPIPGAEVEEVMLEDAMLEDVDGATEAATQDIMDDSVKAVKEEMSEMVEEMQEPEMAEKMQEPEAVEEMKKPETTDDVPN